MLSIVIPTYFDPYLQKTIDSILKNAQGKIEVLPILDGYTPPEPLKKDPRVKAINIPINMGMRNAINIGIEAASGKFIMKCDSHCAFGPGFDKILTKNIKYKWLLIPRRYSLDEINWDKNIYRPTKDYHYLTFPNPSPTRVSYMTPQDWSGKTRERRSPKYDIDDTMIFQGSCWAANKLYFKKLVGHLDDSADAYGPFGGEQIEIGLKYWLGGGAVKVIKKTWYAHLSKRPGHYREGMFTRKYKSNPLVWNGRTWLTKHWMSNQEPNMKHKLSWLIGKFWPVPGWPEDRSLWAWKG